MHFHTIFTCQPNFFRSTSLENHLCEFVVPVEPFPGIPHNLMLTRRSSRPCRAFVCPLVKFGAQQVRNVQLSFPSCEPPDELWDARRSRTHPFLTAREIGDVMQFISGSFSASSCQVFAWTRRCSSMFVTPGPSNPLLASSLMPSLFTL